MKLTLLIALLCVSLTSFGKTKRRDDAQLAATVPMIDMTPKQELIKFIPCESENDCFKALQESEVELDSPDEKTTVVAEFVQAPKKGLNILKKSVP